MDAKNDNHNIPNKKITLGKNDEKNLENNKKNDSLNDNIRDQNKTDIAINNNSIICFDKGKNENFNQNQNCIINNITESSSKITKEQQNIERKSNKNKKTYCNCCFGYKSYFCYNSCNKCYSKMNIKNCRCYKCCKNFCNKCERKICPASCNKCCDDCCCNCDCDCCCKCECDCCHCSDISCSICCDEFCRGCCVAICNIQ